VPELEVAVAVKGFALLRNAVPQQLVDAASALIQVQWTQDKVSADTQAVEQWSQKTFVPRLSSAAPILALFTPTISSAVDQLLGASGYPVPDRAQVAIRLHHNDPLAVAQPDKDWHCDGVYCPHLEAGELRTFELLVGILVSPVATQSEGSLVVQPGGHLRMADCFKNGCSFADDEQVPSSAISGDGVAILGQPGDALILHHLVPHRVGGNAGTKDRIVVYFRVKCYAHDASVVESLGDPWLHMPHLRHVTSSG